jgi:hypothetical protein
MVRKLLSMCALCTLLLLSCEKPIIADESAVSGSPAGTPLRLLPLCLHTAPCG